MENRSFRKCCILACKIAAVFFTMFMILCVIEHSANLAKIEPKPSTILAFISSKCVDFFMWCGKTLARISYFMCIGPYKFACYLKDNLWLFIKNIGNYIVDILKWIDNLLKLNQFLLSVWSIIKGISNIIVSPLYFFSGYFLSVIEWSRAAVLYAYTNLSLLEIEVYIYWHAMWYLVGTLALIVVFYIIYKKFKRKERVHED